MATKANVEELRKLLHDPEIQRNKAKYGLIIRKVIACMTLGMDVSPLFGEMTMAAATDDLIQKKLAYMYICRYADRFPDLAVLTINTLQKDCKDNSAIVRSLALRSFCSLRLSNLNEYIREPLLNGLTDDNFYVRKTAVMGCASISQFSSKLIEDLGIIDKLYAMLKDPHPLVISNCVVALDEIMVKEGGIAINRNIANYLLNNLRHFNEWSQCYILDMLNRYKPHSEEEICDILNLIDDRLQQGNSGVVFSAAKLFLKLTEYFKDIRDHVFRRLKEPLLTITSAGCPELAHVCLKHIQILLNESPRLFDDNYNSFYFRYNDPNYIKLQKLNILKTIATANNASNIINELSSYVTDIDITIAVEAIICMGQIALQVVECCEHCMQKLISLLSLETDFITSHTLQVIKDLLRKYPWLADMFIPEINQLDEISQDPDGKCAMIWILGEFGQIIEKSPYLLEEIIENITEESSSMVKLHLMTATMKLFFKRPPECVSMLSKLFQYIINEESDIDVRDRGLFYYRLLCHDINKAEQIISMSRKEISIFAEDSTTNTNKAVKSSTFNTIAVIYNNKDCDIEPNVYNQAINAFISSEDIDKSQVNEESQDVFSLNLQAIMSPAEFEKQWFSTSHSTTVVYKLKEKKTSQEFEHYFTSLGIVTIAASKPDQYPMKYFFFAQKKSSEENFLIECSADFNELTLSMNIKCPNSEIVNNLLIFLEKSLQLVGWLAS